MEATCEEQPQVTVEKSEEVKLYSEDALLRLTGTVKNHLKTDVVNLFSNRYRINVWTEERRPDRLFSHYKIPKSFFAYLEDGEFVDKTIKPRVKPGQKMNVFAS